MAIVSISRGSYSLGQQVAEQVAERLGYSCLARDVLITASREFNLPEIVFLRAIEDAPSLLDRLRGGKARYIVYVRSALLGHLRNDDVVYHGLAGHFFLREIRHVLKVRILADVEDRLAVVRAREGVSEKKALRLLEKADEVRRQWGQSLYGINPEDPALYDAVIHVGKMGVPAAVDIICDLADHEPYRTTPESQADIEDLALGAAFEALLVDMEVEPGTFDVSAQQGSIHVRLMATPHVKGGTDREFRNHYADDLWRRLRERGRELPGFRSVDVELNTD